MPANSARAVLRRRGRGANAGESAGVTREVNSGLFLPPETFCAWFICRVGEKGEVEMACGETGDVGEKKISLTGRDVSRSKNRSRRGPRLRDGDKIGKKLGNVKCEVIFDGGLWGR